MVLFAANSHGWQSENFRAEEKKKGVAAASEFEASDTDTSDSQREQPESQKFQTVVLKTVKRE